MDLIQQGRIPLPCPAGSLLRLDGFGTAHIGGVLAAKGKFGQTQGVGTVGAGLARRDQLIGGGDGVGNERSHLQQQVLPQGGDLRPVFDVGTQLEQGVVAALAKALVDPGIVAGAVVLVLRYGRIVIHLGGGGQQAVRWPQWSGHPSAPRRTAGRNQAWNPPGWGSCEWYAGWTTLRWRAHLLHQSTDRRKPCAPLRRWPSADQ